MTYCVAVKTRAGLVFLSDSRTNAGLDQISTFRKMIVYEKAGDRFMTLLSAGNLSISQSVREVLQIEKLVEPGQDEPLTLGFRLSPGPYGQFSKPYSATSLPLLLELHVDSVGGGRAIYASSPTPGGSSRATAVECNCLYQAVLGSIYY
jgi:hypothetical protein